jgi:hypothetical protein
MSQIAEYLEVLRDRASEDERHYVSEYRDQIADFLEFRSSEFQDWDDPKATVKIQICGDRLVEGEAEFKTWAEVPIPEDLLIWLSWVSRRRYAGGDLANRLAPLILEELTKAMAEAKEASDV